MKRGWLHCRDYRQREHEINLTFESFELNLNQLRKHPTYLARDIFLKRWFIIKNLITFDVKLNICYLYKAFIIARKFNFIV